MRKFLSSLILLLLLASPAWAALSANTVWEYRTATGSSNNNGAAAVWLDLTVAATYKWTASLNGTNEYYLEAAAGGNPSITFTDSGNKTSVMVDGNFNLAAEGTKGSLVAGTYDYGDNDSLGYSTIYVRLSDGSDPDTKVTQGILFQVGLFKGGGHDWSQQAAPQYALTGCTSAGAGAIILNANAATDMVGNILTLVSGTNSIPGRYEVISVVAGVSITVDSNCTSGALAIGVVNVGGSLLLPTDAIWETFIAGNRIFIKADGTYTLTASISISTAVGAMANPINVIGYQTTRGDNPTGTNRTNVACGAYTMIGGSYWSFYNISWTTTATLPSYVNAAGIWYNCKSVQLSDTPGRLAAYLANAQMIKSEIVSINGIGIGGASSGGGLVSQCYIHDCGQYGIDWGTYDGHTVLNSVIAECLVAVSGGAASGATYHTFLNNVLYKSDNAAGSVGFQTDVASSIGWRIENNIIQGFATAFSYVEQDYSHHIDYNDIFSNTANFTNTIGGSHNIFTDPQLKNPQGTLIENAEDAWNEYAGTGVTATADGAVFKVGTYSAKAACDATTDVEVVMTEAIPATDMSGYGGIRLWAYSSVALNAGDWQLLLDDSANCATPVVTLSFPAMAAATWYWIYLNNTSFASATNIVSIGVKQAVDKGAMNFYVDNVRASDCDFTIAGASGAIKTGLAVGTTEGLQGVYPANMGVDLDTTKDVFGMVQ